MGKVGAAQAGKIFFLTRGRERGIIAGMMENPEPLRAFSGRAMLGAGIYFLVFAGEVVFVGKAKRMLARVQTHRQLCERMRAGKAVPQGGVKAVIFSDFFVFPCDEVDLGRLHKHFIERFRPRKNEEALPKRSLAEAGFDFTRLSPGLVKQTPLWRRI